MRKNTYARFFYFACSILLLSACGSSDQANSDELIYKDASRSVDDRTDDLLSRMTLDEKIGQVKCMWLSKFKLYDSQGQLVVDSLKKHVASGLGQIGRPSEPLRGGDGPLSPLENAKLTNRLQKYFIEETRLGIPVIFHEECLHGHAAQDATSFSQPIGLGSTWNTDLVEQLFTMTAKEARVRGTHLALTPVVDVAREPRWGRVEETYGEDPYLVSRMGLSAVRGFQGRGDKIDENHIMSTLKHFAAHGQPESGNNIAPVNVSERTLRETFLYPFKVCVEQGGVKGIMASYNEIDGVPSHASTWLLDDVLRGEWDFDGIVVSDYYAIEELSRRHSVAKDYKESACMALKAGVDIELPDPLANVFLKEAIENGELDIAYLDKAVRRIIKQKFELGLFDNPYVDESKTSIVGSPEHAKLALQAAEETMVLLKNDGNIAPIDMSAIKNIAVIGPNADRELLGGYSDHPKGFVTVLEGIKAKVGGKVNVKFAQGCKVTADSVMDNGKMIAASWYKDPIDLVSDEENDAHIKEAVRVAANSDVVVLCIGGNELTSREGWAESHLGDRTDLQMVGRQKELVREIMKTGKPVIVLLFNGKPLAVSDLKKQVPTIFECWYMGQETGTAVANVLFGDVNPSGKLPISFPRSVGHIPCYYNYKPTARRGYLFDDVSPLFAFGHGLSYTTFEYGKPSLSSSTSGINDTVKVSVEITNTGDRDGYEVAQMYIRDKISSVTRPVKELKGFDKVMIGAGESLLVTFDILPEHLAMWDINMNNVVEPGEFDIMVGGSSVNEALQTVTLTVEAPSKSK